MVAPGDSDCSLIWPESERRNWNLWVVLFYLFLPPKALEMVGPDVLLRQPQDEVKQDWDENQAHPHPTSISSFFFFVKKGRRKGCSFYRRCSCAPPTSPQFSSALPPHYPLHTLTAEKIASKCSLLTLLVLS
jgi:hypothetical protein